MNDLEVIRAFAGVQAASIGVADEAPIVRSGDLCPAALKALAHSNEWLRDQSLVGRVISRLEDTETQSPEARKLMTAIYMKLMRPNGQHAPVQLNTICIKISDQEALDLPKRMLMCESSVLEEWLSGNSLDIDLSGKASPAALRHLITHLATGETDFVTQDNAIELLLLAKKYGLGELAMSCLESALDRCFYPLDLEWNRSQVSDEETRLRNLLWRVKLNSITISRFPDGIPYIRMDCAVGEAPWNYLWSLHSYIPITHLKLNGAVNLDSLLRFCARNDDLVSLDLGYSPSVTDQYMEELSQYLPKLKVFSIQNAAFKAIPQVICDQLTTLKCNNCKNLANVSAPNVVVLDCLECDGLTSINAPNVLHLNCGYCQNLLSLSAPMAVTVGCKGCCRLQSIDAPKVVKFDCSDCDALTTICAPNAAELTCNNCRTLVNIIADNAVKLVCHDCPVLTDVSAAAALTISCNNCYALVGLRAPGVTKLYCSACYKLKKIAAPCAVTLNCNYNYALTCIDAPNVAELDLRGCTALPKAEKSKLFNVVHRNIILSNYKHPERLLHLHKHHFEDADTIYRLDAAPKFPLKQWFDDAMRLCVPADFDTPEERAECEGRITDLLAALTTLAADWGHFPDVNLSWFGDLKKCNSLQQQLGRVLWLGGFVACVLSDENPLNDPRAIPTLKAIGELSNPILQENATRVLLSTYGFGFGSQYTRWVELSSQSPVHLLLPCLFFAHANIVRGGAKTIMEGLHSRYYMDFKVLNPILEMVSKLSQDRSLTFSERKKILKMVLRVPKNVGSKNAKAFAMEISAFRVEQAKWVNACRDLLFFGRAVELKKCQNVEDLRIRHKKVCQEPFGVKDELLYSFIDTFNSKRLPQALFTYAARLQVLPGGERVLLTELLGRFVNSVLEGAFPASRYDTSKNAHLKRVFQDNPSLLEKWKEPLDIDLKSGRVHQDSGVASHEVVRDLMTQAINNRHLGADQETLYPTLVAALRAQDSKDVSTLIFTLESRLHDAHDQLKNTPAGSQPFSKEAVRNLVIELLCMRALDPNLEFGGRMELLGVLYEKLSAGVQFKADVQGMLNTLSPSKTATSSWVRLQTTESWEDLLLMGTEVNNSCQRIDGDPYFNKCLLAYVLDGKNKLMIVRDSRGRIAARSVLRILWDGQRDRPVLFMEQIYISSADPALRRWIREGCEKVARRMGLPLVASPSCFPQGDHFKGALSAFGGPAPYEYVDAIGGILKNGEFTILTSKIIYMPDPAPAA